MQEWWNNRQVMNTRKTPSAGYRLTWLMNRIAGRISAMSKEFLVLYLVEQCQRCGNAIRCGSYWGCASRNCSYSICNACLPEVFRLSVGDSKPKAGVHAHRLVCKEIAEKSPSPGGEIKSCPQSPASPWTPTSSKNLIQPESDNATMSMPSHINNTQLSPLPNNSHKSKVLGLGECTETIETEPLMPPSIFDQRLELLWFCQQNDCQFDNLRRAAYSTKVLLDRMFDVGTMMELES